MLRSTCSVLVTDPPHTHTRKPFHAHIHTCTHKHTHTHIHTYTHARIHMQAHAHAHARTHTCTHAHTHARTRTADLTAAHRAVVGLEAAGARHDPHLDKAEGFFRVEVVLAVLHASA